MYLCMLRDAYQKHMTLQCDLCTLFEESTSLPKLIPVSWFKDSDDYNYLVLLPIQVLVEANS
jgi:hypothetical protein